MREGKVRRFLFGLMGDAVTTATVLMFVVSLTLIIGGLLIFLNFYPMGDLFWFVGAMLSLMTIPVIVIIGVLNYNILYKLMITKGRGPFKYLKKEVTDPRTLSQGDRISFILQKFTSLGIALVLFGIFLVIASGLIGLGHLFKPLIYLFWPLSFPFVVLTITMPALAWLSFAYAFDPYEPEPRGMLVFALVLGMLSTFPSLFLNTWNDGWMSEVGISSAVVSAPIFEELFKAIFFVLIYKHLDDETDGLIYGVAFGAGFALLENFLYGFNASLIAGGFGFFFLIGFRSFANMLVHIIGPATIGFLIGFCKSTLRYKLTGTRGARKGRMISLAVMVPLVGSGYLFAVINHAIWNGAATIGSFALLILPVQTIICIVLFVSLVVIGFILGTRRFDRRRDLAS